MKTLGRNLGLGGVVAISVGAMIGGGLFVLPGLAAARTGPSLWLAYLVAGFLVLPAALSKSELATGMPGSGGTYVYIERSMGPLAGTIAGVGAGLSLLFKACFALLGLTWSLGLLLPASWAVSEAQLSRASLIVLFGLAAVNVLGVAKVGRVQVLLVVVSVSVLVLALLSGLPSVTRDHLEPAFPSGLAGLLSASAFVFVSYAGVTKIAAVAEEVKNPSRNIPLGILLSLGMMTVLFAVTCFTMLGVVPWQELAGDVSPFPTFMRGLHGPVAGAAAAIVAALALLSDANAGILTSSRFPLAMARDSLLPRVLSRVHPTFLTPTNSILLTTAGMTASILLLDVEKVVKLASGFQIFIFAVENFALIVFRESGAGWYRPTFRAPLYPWLQIAGIAGGAVLLVMLGKVAWIGVLGFSLVAAVWYSVYGRRAARPPGILQQILSGGVPAATSPGSAVEALDARLPEARVVVALFGKERSPESLLEMADGLRASASDRIDVLLMQEVPEQTVLADLPPDDRTASFRRRIEARADELEVPIFFDKVVTRDLREALYEETVEASCQWLLMTHRRRRQATFVRSPLERLHARLKCDVALFRDAGIRVYRRIFVLAEPGPHDALVVRTADGLARRFGAELTFVDAVPEDAGEERAQAVAAYHEELKRLSSSPSRSDVLRGDDRVATIVHASVAYDLLVLAVDAELPVRNIFIPSASARITSRALCSVLQLRSPREQTHQTVEKLHEALDKVDLVEYLSSGALRARLDARVKKTLFGEVASAFATELGLSREEVEEGFWSRERMQNTAVGHSIAIPHATVPGARRTLVGLFTLDPPVDYQLGNSQTVDVCVATV
ncbi:MAG: amino acid permease, partial [Acidobacteriota bacterium]|nr:amino acid permease [Acidobacteriota bacterium]